MFQSERMKKVSVLALERDIDPLVMGLGRLGVIHLTPPAKESELLSRSDRDAELKRLQAVERRVERVATVLSVPLDAQPPETPELFASLQEIGDALTGLEPEMDRITASQHALSEESADLRQLIEQVAGFEGTEFSPTRMQEYSFVHFALGTMDTDRLESLQSQAGSRVLVMSVKPLNDKESRVLAITSKEGSKDLDDMLSKYGFKAETVKGRSSKPSAEDESLRRTLSTLAERHGKELRRFWRQLGVREKILRAHENFGKTQSTYLISGWVPVRLVENFAVQALDLAAQRAIIHIDDPDDLAGGEEPPTSLRHSWLTRPFSLIVTSYGYPRYREIEPTVLVALTYFLMYGAMFGDVGQGSVLVLGGLAMWRWMKTSATKDFGLLVAYCGVSAILFGFAYGAFFGTEGTVIRPLWGKPMETENARFLLMISVIVGVVIISAGVLLNVLNKMRTGNWASALFARFGIAGIAFYWGGLGLAVKYVVGGGVSGTTALLVLLVPLGLIFLKEPVAYVLLRGDRKDASHGAEAEEAAGHEAHPGGVGGFFVAVMEGALEVFESVLIYLSNTASFVRIGAYALAHAALCMVIFAFSDLLYHTWAGSAGSGVLIVLGNIVVIGLEGVVVGVQVLRLEYYEFFGKFLSGEGKAYKPFDLKSEES